MISKKSISFLIGETCVSTVILPWINFHNIYFSSFFLPLTLTSYECRQTKPQLNSEQASVTKSCWDTASGQGLVAQETVNGVFKWILLPSSSNQEMYHSAVFNNTTHLLRNYKKNTRPDMISNHTPFYRSKLTGNTAYETSLVT